MASYGAFIAACGFTYNGPKGQIGFAPKVNPENFKAAFTAAEGWGSLQQTRSEYAQTNSISLAYGKLAIQQIEIALPQGRVVLKLEVAVNQKPIDASFTNIADKTVVVFDRLELKENDVIVVVVGV
jgi:hypothetical protein